MIIRYLDPWGIYIYIYKYISIMYICRNHMQCLRIISLCTMSAIAIMIGYRLERIYIYVYTYL